MSLVCEVCGSNDLVKQDGVFVCQVCGSKYSIDEVRKMLDGSAVEKAATDQTNPQVQVMNLMINADRAYEDGRYHDSENLYSRILELDPNNAHAILYQAYSICWQGTLKDIRLPIAIKAGQRAMDLYVHQLGPSKKLVDKFTDFLNFYKVTTAYVTQAQNVQEQLLKNANQKLKEIESEGKRVLSQISTTSVFENTKQRYLNRINELSNEVERQGNSYRDIMVSSSNYLAIMGDIYATKAATLDFPSDVGFNAATILSLFIDNMKKDKIVDDTREKLYQKISSEIKIIWNKAVSKYRSEHSEEMEQIDRELKPLQEEIIKVTQDIDSKKDQISSIQNKVFVSVNANVKKEIENNITLLSQQLSKLGLFKRSEKEKLRIQIDGEKTKLMAVEKEIKAEKKNWQEENERGINQINQEIEKQDVLLKELREKEKILLDKAPQMME